MLKLLKFYIPFILKNTFIHFGVALFAVLALNFLPIEESDKSFAQGLLIIVFPLFTYFHQANYLSASMNWILLTPLSKKTIIATNGLINIFKILTISIFMKILLSFVSTAESTAVKTAEFFQKESDISNAGFLMLFLFVGVLAFGFIFSIFTNEIHKGSKKQNHIKDKSLLVKRYSSIALVILIAISLFSEEATIPDVLKISVLCAAFVTVFFYSTLRSIRYNFNLKMNYLVFGVSLVGMFTMCYQLVMHEAQDKSLSMGQRIQAASFLEGLPVDINKNLLGELKLAGDKTRLLSKSTLVILKKSEGNSERLKGTILALLKLCEERMDHSCRLAGVLTMEKENQSGWDLIRKGCQNDVKSCAYLLERMAPSKTDSEYALKKRAAHCMELKNKKAWDCRNENKVKAKIPDSTSADFQTSPSPTPPPGNP